VCAENNPLVAKEVAWRHESEFDPLFREQKVGIMRWVVRVKISANIEKMLMYIAQTKSMPIVELSKNDDFWGAIRQRNGTLQGKNVLGRIWMECRQMMADDPTVFSIVNPPSVGHLRLMGEPIRAFNREDPREKRGNNP
jgi:predicted NAD-dependent protein-ADP-ribosyltransferase YbiA (DUF1768 family)